MLWSLLATVLLAPTGTAWADPVAAALQRFEQLEGYQVTVRSTGTHGQMQVIRYAYRKPGFVRMDFVAPHAGALMIYNPYNGRVSLWPFGHPGLNLSLAPDNPLIRGPEGRRIDRSHVGILLHAVQTLQSGGTTASLGQEAVGSWTTQQWSITGAPGKTVGGVHHFLLWLAEGAIFPVKVVSFGLDGGKLETVMMDDVALDPSFSTDFFQP